MIEEFLQSVRPGAFHEPPGRQDAEAFRRVVESRRSVRVFLPDPVDPALVAQAIDWALLSPSSSNLSPMEFHWARTPAVKAALVSHCFGQPAAATAQELVAVVARTRTWRRNAALMTQALEALRPDVPDAVFTYYRRVVPSLYTQGPWGILGCLRGLVARVTGLFRPVPREPHGLRAMDVWATKSAALAAQTFMLALRALDLDSCPMEGMDARRVAKTLGLPRDAIVLMVIGVGKRREDAVYGPRLRLDRALFVKEH